MKKNIMLLALIASITTNVLIFAQTESSIQAKDIKDLIERKVSRGFMNKLPDIDANGTLDLSNLGLTSLKGAEKIDKSNRAKVINLKLNDNYLQELEPNLLSVFPNLQSLSLQNNQLKKIFAGAFQGLRSLKELDLSNNQINSIQYGTLQVLPELQKLNLSHNKINFETVNSGAFAELSGLQEFNLAYNEIKKLPDNPFADLVELRNIDFTGNPIVFFPAGAFKNLPKLQKVYKDR